MVSQFIDMWRQVGDCIALLDVLFAFRMFAMLEGARGPLCLPTFINSTGAPTLLVLCSSSCSACLRHQAMCSCPDGQGPVLQLTDSWHVCVDLGSAAFVPNNITIGGTGPGLIVVTGPNMGGKSTLLRQTALAVILAQMGAYVPARTCSLTLVDKIFTRVGANDKILAGQSTFFVELNETSTILKHSTRRSLVILDELGRGTSTWDGAALASAVARYLAHTVCERVWALEL
jgi:DNA mismatch repair protein MSH6